MKKIATLLLTCILAMAMMLATSSCALLDLLPNEDSNTDVDDSTSGSGSEDNTISGELGIGVGGLGGIDVGGLGFDSLLHYEQKEVVKAPEYAKDEGTKKFYRMEAECAKLSVASGEVFNDFRHLGFDLRLSGGFATRNLNHAGTKITFTFNSDADYSGVTLRIMIGGHPSYDSIKVSSALDITNNGWTENDSSLVVEKSECKQLGHNNWMIFTIVETEITVKKGENQLVFEYLQEMGCNLDYIEIGTSANITGFDNTKYWEDKNATYEIVKEPTVETTGTLRLTTLHDGATQTTDYTLPALSTDNGYTYEKDGSKETWSFKVKNQVMEIVYNPDATYTLALKEGCGLTFEGGATSVQLKDGDAMPAVVGNTKNLLGYYNADNTSKIYGNDFVMGKENITLVPYYAISENHQWLNPCSAYNGYLLNVNEKYGTPQMDNAFCSTVVGIIYGGKTTALKNGVLSTSDNTGIAQVGRIITYTGSAVVGQAFRVDTKVSTEAVVTKGVLHEFVYNLENKGSETISFTMYQINSSADTEDSGVDVVLASGESMTVVYQISFVNGGNNTNALTLFKVKDAMNGFKLGISVSVDLEVKTEAEHQHEYSSVVTAPTCTEQGYTTYTCSGCGDSYVDDYVNATDHAWNEGEVTTQPTCTEKGVKTYTCTHNSAHTYTEDVAALGHTDENGDYVCDVEDCKEALCTNHIGGTAVVENNVDPTCETAGSYDSVVYCTVCKVEMSRTTETVAALKHNYESSITTEPSGENGGVRTYTCKNNSSHTYTEVVYKLSVGSDSNVTIGGESAVYLMEGESIPEITGTVSGLLGYYNLDNAGEFWTVEEWYTEMPARSITIAPYYQISDEHQWLDVLSGYGEYLPNNNSSYGSPQVSNSKCTTVITAVAGGKTTILDRGVLSSSEDIGVAQIGRTINYTGSLSVGQAFRIDTQVSDSIKPVVLGVAHEFVYNFENKGTEKISLIIYQVNSGATTEDSGVDVVLQPGESMTVVYRIEFANGSNNANALTLVKVKENMANGMSLGVSVSFNDRLSTGVYKTLTLAESSGLTFEDGTTSKQVEVGAAFPTLIGEKANLVAGYYDPADITQFSELYAFVMPNEDITVAPYFIVSEDHQQLDPASSYAKAPGCPNPGYGNPQTNASLYTSSVSIVKGGTTTLMTNGTLSTSDAIGTTQIGRTISYSGSLAVGQMFRLETKVGDTAVVTKGVTHEFVYNFENKGTEKLSFTVYQINSGTTLEDSGVVIELDPGESMTLVYTIAFKNGSDNKNAMLFFKVKEAMTNGMSLGISASVNLG